MKIDTYVNNCEKVSIDINKNYESSNLWHMIPISCNNSHIYLYTGTYLFVEKT